MIKINREQLIYIILEFLSDKNITTVTSKHINKFYMKLHNYVILLQNTLKFETIIFATYINNLH